MSRPETGPLKFSGDWTGLFIRGDNALGMSFALSDLLVELGAAQRAAGINGVAQLVLNPFQLRALSQIVPLLQSVDEREDASAVCTLMPFEKCRHSESAVSPSKPATSPQIDAVVVEYHKLCQSRAVKSVDPGDSFDLEAAVGTLVHTIMDENGSRSV